MIDNERKAMAAWLRARADELDPHPTRAKALPPFAKFVLDARNGWYVLAPFKLVDGQTIAVHRGGDVTTVRVKNAYRADEGVWWGADYDEVQP